MLRRLLPVFVLLVATGCAQAPIQPLGTPSGRPEVLITGATKKEIVDTLVGEVLATGMQLKRMDEYSAVFGKRDESFGAALLFGSRYDSTPEMRVTFNFVDVPGGVRVYCTGAMVTNPGSSFERVNDATAANGKEIQAMLERLRSRLSR